MRSVVIFEDEEYVRRLSDYLTRRMSSDVRVCGYSSMDFFEASFCGEHIWSRNVYLVNEKYVNPLIERGILDPIRRRRVIVLSEEKEGGDFCKWNRPNELLSLIEKKLLEGYCDNRKEEEHHRLIAVYAPYCGVDIRERLKDEMTLGSLYLGLQDLGIQEEVCNEQIPSNPVGKNRFHMGDLCYFVHLKGTDIGAEIEGMMQVEDGRYYLDSAPWYFDFLGMSQEDYLHLFEQLKGETRYSDIYVGLGNCAVTSLDYFHQFDRVIVLDQPDNRIIHEFCNRFCEALLSASIVPADCLEVRGDIF